MQAPQTHWLRKTLFQIHLWTGISLGLYVLTISITGSAILLQPSIVRLFTPSNLAPVETSVLNEQALQDRIAEVYSEYEVYFVLPSNGPERATYVVLNKDGGVFPRYFNQFTGEDLGPSNPWPVRSFEWLVNVHDDLLMGKKGRKLNGLGGVVFLLMALTGSIIWWQGRLRWKDSLQIKRNSSRSFNWQLHSFIGFWSLFLMFSWGLSGAYLGFPKPFNYLMDWFDSDLADFERPNAWLKFVMNIHFARFGEGAWGRGIWIILGLLPTVMVVSGFIIWWKRVVMKINSEA